jgi:hypothetical protein
LKWNPPLEDAQNDQMRRKSLRNSDKTLRSVDQKTLTCDAKKDVNTVMVQTAEGYFNAGLTDVATLGEEAMAYSTVMKYLREAQLSPGHSTPLSDTLHFTSPTAMKLF